MMFGQEMDQDVKAAEQEDFMRCDIEFHGQLR